MDWPPQTGGPRGRAPPLATLLPPDRALARTKVGHAPRAVADEEDAALSAFRNLCEATAQGRFDLLHDRDDLWRLLVVITARKAADLKKRQNRVKRGGGRILGQGDLAAATAVGLLRCRAGIRQVTSRRPSSSPSWPRNSGGGWTGSVM